MCQFLLMVCFKVRISRISDKTDKFLLNHSNLFGVHFLPGHIVFGLSHLTDPLSAIASCVDDTANSFGVIRVDMNRIILGYISHQEYPMMQSAKLGCSCLISERSSKALFMKVAEHPISHKPYM